MTQKIPDSLCILPWVHFRLGQSGEVSPCCRIDEAYSYGHTLRNTFEEIWEGPKASEFRAAMQRGEKPEACRGCFRLEELGHESQRQVMNTQFKEYFSRVSGEKLEDPIYLDVRLSNICNLSCRSCNSENSTSWYSDAKALNNPTPKGVLRPFTTTEVQKAFFDRLLPNLTALYFAGGEPLLDPAHYELLDLIIASGRTDITLDYNSNFSSLELNGRDILELWKKFPSVTVSASLDGVGTQGELLRKGLHWEQVVRNFKRLKEETPHVRFWVYPTISAMNAFHLPSAIKTFLSEGMLSGPESFLVNVATSPRYINLNIFQPDERQCLKNRYQDFLQELPGILPDANLRQRIQGELKKVIEFIDQPTWVAERKDFRRFIFALDRERQEKFVQKFPELTSLLYEG